MKASNIEIEISASAARRNSEKRLEESSLAKSMKLAAAK